MSSPIKYLTHNQIDKKKWDACIAGSPNGLIYGYSFYLDAMARHWDGLVLNDYEAVMPLTWNKKYGITYLYQPALTQQLGIFSATDISMETIQAFLQAAKSIFRFAEIFLNFRNKVADSVEKKNFTLSLHRKYDEIYAGYSKDAVKNIKRAEKFNLQYKEMDDLHEVVRLYKELYGPRTKHVTETDYRNFEQACIYAQKMNWLVLRKVVDQKGAVAAVALLVHSNQRLYLLQSITLPEGRSKEANYFLLDNIIQEFCTHIITLDFEGSDIPGIAHFYKNFGGINEPYYFYRWNDLAWPIRMFKQ